MMASLNVAEASPRYLFEYRNRHIYIRLNNLRQTAAGNHVVTELDVYGRLKNEYRGITNEIIPTGPMRKSLSISWGLIQYKDAMLPV